jgi:aryl-alcohol dehydrogenase-like predicted oxidoreductase
VTTRRTGRATAGAATPDGTRGHAERRGASGQAWGPLGRTGLTASRLGFGGYRVSNENPVHRAALEAALAGGVNLVDTSTNYADGGSEELVGGVVSDLVRAGRVAREAIIVVSKIGYVQGQNLALAREREATGRPFRAGPASTPSSWRTSSSARSIV